MVSKILKKTATNNKPMSIKRCHGIRRHHRRNLVKKASASAFSVMLTRVGSQKGYKILQKAQARETRPEPETRVERPLPPLTSSEERTVFLDLDETLVHSVIGPPPKNFDFVVRPKIRGKIMTFYVVKRPGVDAFLEKLAAKYEVAVFTAGLREYASLVLDRLDRKRVISHRLYRDACKEVDGKFVKDLSGLGRDLSRLVIVDDNPNAYFLQPENAVPVRPFFEDRADRELGRVLEFFESEGTSCCEDIRDAVRQFVGKSWISSYDDDDDDDDDDDGGDDDGDGDDDDGLELEGKSDGKPKLPVVLTTVSTPCSVISLSKHHPFGTPILEWRTKMVIICSLFLLIVNVILCFRTGTHFFLLKLRN